MWMITSSLFKRLKHADASHPPNANPVATLARRHFRLHSATLHSKAAGHLKGRGLSGKGARGRQGGFPSVEGGDGRAPSEVRVSIVRRGRSSARKDFRQTNQRRIDPAQFIMDVEDLKVKRGGRVRGGRGGGMHGVGGASGDVRARGPGFPPIPEP